jgi:hypothetical protein
MDGTAVIFFTWSAHMRVKFGTKITPQEWNFWTMTFYNLKKFNQSNEGPNFILSPLKVGHWVAQTQPSLTNYLKLQILASYNNLMPHPSIGPKWFWNIQIVLNSYKLFWSDPNCFGQVQIILVRFKLDFYGLVFKIWTQPKWSGPDQIKLDPTKTNWTRPKWFGRSKIILDP